MNKKWIASTFEGDGGQVASPGERDGKAAVDGKLDGNIAGDDEAGAVRAARDERRQGLAAL